MLWLQRLLTFTDNTTFHMKTFKKENVYLFLQKTFFLKSYFVRNEAIWQEGLLIDFLQKKLVDKWVRKFLVISAYLVNERLFFDWVIRLYLDLVVVLGQKLTIFEFNSVGSTLFALLLLFTASSVFTVTLYFFLIF